MENTHKLCNKFNSDLDQLEPHIRSMPTKPATVDEMESRARLRREVGERLRLVRRVLDLSQTEFARRAGIKSNAYNMVEQGDRFPSYEAAISICEAHRISMDWIFRGEPGDMSARLWEGIKALRNAEHD